MADPKSAPVPLSTSMNVMQVTHTEREFFFTFGQVAPQNAGIAHLVAQVVTSPEHAKEILRALQENIRKYEERFAPIPEKAAADPVRKH